jgi:phage gp45-like
MRATERDASRRGVLGFARGVLKSVSTRAGQTKLQHLDIGVLKGETHEGAEHMEAYGITAKPHAGAEVVVAFIGGNRAHPIVISVADRQYRLQGLESGEVALYDDLGQKVHLTRDGIVIEAPKIRLLGDTTIEGKLDILGDSVTHNGKNIGDDHAHSGVTPGADNTGAPV